MCSCAARTCARVLQAVASGNAIHTIMVQMICIELVDLRREGVLLLSRMLIDRCLDIVANANVLQRMAQPSGGAPQGGMMGPTAQGLQ